LCDLRNYAKGLALCESESVLTSTNSEQVFLKPKILYSSVDFQPDQLSGLWQLIEEVVHGADDLGFVGTEDVVIGVGQSDNVS
jgi:hypothetical protein